MNPILVQQLQEGFRVSVCRCFSDSSIAFRNCSTAVTCGPFRCVLGAISPDRRRIQRIVDAAQVNFKHVFRRADLAAELRPSVSARSQARFGEIGRAALLATDAHAGTRYAARLEDDGTIVRHIADHRAAGVSLAEPQSPDPRLLIPSPDRTCAISRSLSPPHPAQFDWLADWLEARPRRDELPRALAGRSAQRQAALASSCFLPGPERLKSRGMRERRRREVTGMRADITTSGKTSVRAATIIGPGR